MKIRTLFAAALMTAAVVVPSLADAQMHHRQTVIVKRHGHVAAVRHYYPHRHVVVVHRHVMHHPMHHGRTVIVHH